MSEKKLHGFHGPLAATCEAEASLHLILYSNSDNAYHPFHVPAQMTVAAFLELALARLSEGDGAKRVEALKRYYLPVLELQETEGERELPSHLSLAEAGVGDEAVCRIVARPLKERIMFCSYG